MSRNFELLQQAGWNQEYFEDSTGEGSPKGARVAEIGPARTKARATAAGKEDQFPLLARRIFLDPRGAHLRVVVFFGIEPEAGCSRVCLQTAEALAGLVDGKVCVVDANVGTESLQPHFGAESPGSLSDAMAQSKPVSLSAQQLDGSNLYFLRLRNAQSKNLPNAAGLAAQVQELRFAFDYVLVDAPLTNRSDVGTIARTGDGAVLILQPNGIPLEKIQKAKTRLKAADIPLLGIVVNEGKNAQPAVGSRFMK